jgi:hypothetical protein
LTKNEEKVLAAIKTRLRGNAFMAWCSAEHEAGCALKAWLDGSGNTDTYLTYRAALDREEAAARDLQRLSTLTKPAERRLLSAGAGA